MECQSQKTKLAENMKRIGFLRVLNEENAVIPCLLSVAPVLDHVVVLWADMDDRSIDLVKEWEHHLCHACQCRVSFLHYPHHVVPPHSVDDLRGLPRENRIDTYLNFGMEFIRRLYEGQLFCVSKIDADQIYFTRELEAAFQMISGPEDCVSIRGAQYPGSSAKIDDLWSSAGKWRWRLPHLRHEQLAPLWNCGALRSGYNRSSAGDPLS